MPERTTVLHSRTEGSGPHILLLHPVGLDLTCWDAVAEALRSALTVTRADMRGHGQSPPARADMRLEDYADDIHALLVARNLGPVAVVGLSFGGMLGQTLGLRYPDDVAQLVVAGCPATLPPAGRQAMVERGEAALRGGMEAVIEPTLQRWFTDGYRAAGGAEPIRRRLLSDDVEGWAAAWRAISRIDNAGRLAEIRKPVLCIAGEFDQAAPPSVLRGIADAIPSAEYAEMPGAPHMMQLEQPAAFADLVRDFLLRTGTEKAPA